MSGGPLSPARPADLVVPRASERARAIAGVVQRTARWSCQGSGSQSLRGLHTGAEPLDVTSGRRYHAAEDVDGVSCLVVVSLILSTLKQKCLGVYEDRLAMERTSTLLMVCTLIYGLLPWHGRGFSCLRLSLGVRELEWRAALTEVRACVRVFRARIGFHTRLGVPHLVPSTSCSARSHSLAMTLLRPAFTLWQDLSRSALHDETLQLARPPRTPHLPPTLTTLCYYDRRTGMDLVHPALSEYTSDTCSAVPQGPHRPET